MQTHCDKCGKSVKSVGRLANIRWKGLNQKLCKDCKKKLKMSYH